MTNLIKSIILIAAWLSATATEAHQPNISSVMLIEQESGTWTVQFNAGILGFQYAVEEEHGKGSYSTVEKFNQLLLAHLHENMEILINSESYHNKNNVK